VAAELPRRCDVAVVGGGIVGLACALAVLRRFPDLRLVVVEKEAEVGTHQTGHNSGVVHAGIYYRPGSLRAKLCVEGARRMRAFCEAEGLPFQQVGKVIVATSHEEVPHLEELFRRGRANGVEGLRWLSPEELREVEPHAAGVAAIHSPATAITDFRAVARRMAERVAAAGGVVVTSCRLTAGRRLARGFALETTRGDLQADGVLNCAGLHSDHVAWLLGARAGLRVVPFRGEYYLLRPERRHLVRGLIYPVPDPRFPFLGVHLTRTVHGEVEVGPNAVLAWAREGYTARTVRFPEAFGTLAYPGFWRLALRYWRVGLYELYRSWSRAEFARSAQRLVPALEPGDLVRDGSGVRAQAVALDGSLVDDFRIVVQPGAVHVLNAPSPAATASLAIGDYVAELAAQALELGQHVPQAARPGLS
jgi:L-2-hydroxyglutarate oxidase